jgi:glutamyl-Q tRNA(Asp) synthetase
MSQPVFRLAPSPTGLLHVGHAYSVLLNQRMAKETTGRLLLRIEDTDQSRVRAEFVTAIFEDLEWLGLRWEEPVRIQSEHFEDYEAVLQKLWKSDHVFPCFCSRKDVAERSGAMMNPDGQPLYDGTCRHIPRDDAARRIDAGQAFGWRLKTEHSPAAHWGDAMIAKPGTGSWYHIAVVVDDALQGVTHVVRGKDIEPATPLHMLLQKLLGLPSPHYHHHDLIMGEDGQKLSKKFSSTSLRSLREHGMTIDDLRKKVGLESTTRV